MPTINSVSLTSKRSSKRNASPSPSPSKGASSRRSSGLPAWVRGWFIVASILVGMDCLYVLGVEYELKERVPGFILKLWGWYGESDVQ